MIVQNDEYKLIYSKILMQYNEFENFTFLTNFDKNFTI